MPWPQLECENRVGKVVPINDELRAADEADPLDHRERWNRRWVLGSVR